MSTAPIRGCVCGQIQFFKIMGFAGKSFLHSPPPPLSFLFFWQDNSYCALRNKNVSREAVCPLNGHINLKDFLCWNRSCTCIHWAPLCGIVRTSIRSFHWAQPFFRPDRLCLVLWGWFLSWVQSIVLCLQLQIFCCYESDSVGFVYQVFLQLGCKFEKLTQMISNQSFLI